jgi:glycosyltransferase involved in cell wall biosynthesis
MSGPHVNSELIPKVTQSSIDTHLTQYLDHHHHQYPLSVYRNISILFILAEVSISGGIVSILQEVISMRSRGLRVHIAVTSSPSLGEMNAFIHGLSPTNVTLLEGMILTFSGKCCYPNKAPNELIELAGSFDIVIGTYFTTISAVIAISERYPLILPAYYVQDYEPWFLCNPKECLVDGTTRSFLEHNFLDIWSPRERNRRAAYEFSLSTYNALDHKIFMFAKTKWIIEMVTRKRQSKLTGGKGKEANVVHQVTPSIDHLTYYPSPHALSYDESKVIQVIAMIRPRTSRRNSMVCLDLMLRLAHEFSQRHETHPRVTVVLFGSTREVMIELFTQLIVQKGPSPHRNQAVLLGPNVQLLEILKSRYSLADLYRQSQIFVDVSWWQAFGRSGVEAMACGCVAIFPQIGAASEVCEGGGKAKACLSHDGDDVDGFYHTITSVVRNHTLRQLLSAEGLRRSQDFRVELAAASIVSTLKEGLDKWRKVKKRN